MLHLLNGSTQSEGTARRAALPRLRADFWHKFVAPRPLVRRLGRKVRSEHSTLACRARRDLCQKTAPSTFGRRRRQTCGAGYRAVASRPQRRALRRERTDPIRLCIPEKMVTGVTGHNPRSRRRWRGLHEPRHRVTSGGSLFLPPCGGRTEQLRTARSRAVRTQGSASPPKKSTARLHYRRRVSSGDPTTMMSNGPVP